MASPDDQAAIKQIKIRTGVVKRIGKECAMYAKEVTKQEEHIEKMKSDGKDEYDIRKQNEVLEESRMMIPDTNRRLKAAKEELTQLLEGNSHLQEKEEYIAAQTLLKE
ncbi:hypothetical protein CAPTEDRAFT_179546 [Capitella teleta]|uniref:Tubulin-specific chaperone A n=1 Tax=Capitella teleta TaxID=283909 RepID=R7UTK4_CAPTE|nr:hypothetical protein CAPTEDRAFT_179546 [Capitella teleta]|eukprot:ELU06721.1 hypothetical protein CAPTEDRAFT_179546 [Capitella teleta]